MTLRDLVAANSAHRTRKSLMQVSAARTEAGDISIVSPSACLILRHASGDTSSNTGFEAMDKDRIKGSAKKAEGSVKEGLGKATGNTSLKVEGKIEKAEGRLQNAFGKAQDALRKV